MNEPTLANEGSISATVALMRLDCCYMLVLGHLLLRQRGSRNTVNVISRKFSQNAC